MNINIILSVVAALSFDVTFNIGEGREQNYFIFNGNDTSAHLFRNNTSLHLILQSENDYKQCYKSVQGDHFTFTWNGFKINEIEMECFESNDKMRYIYSDFTFMSPWISLEETPKNIDIEEVYQWREINYNLLALIVLAIGALLKLDQVLLLIIKKVHIKRNVHYQVQI